MIKSFTMGLMLLLVLVLQLILVPVSSQPSWSSVVANSPTFGTSVSSLIGGVEDPAHLGVNCSCVDRHKARILFIPDLLDSSYAGQLIREGAKRAAIDFGVQLHITPSKALSTDTMAQWINQARTNNNTNSHNENVFFPSYPGSPDWVISGLPSSSVNVEPLSSLLSMYATSGIPFSSVHSANLGLIQQLAKSDVGHVWHVGADNVYTGQVAAQQLIQQMNERVNQQAPNQNGSVKLTDIFTPVAICFSDMIGLEAGDDRCQGWSSVWSSLNVTVVIGSVNSLTADYHPILTLMQTYIVNGRALPIFAVDDEAMQVVTSAIIWGGPDLTNQQINQATHSNTNITITVPPLWIATVDVSVATATALSSNGVVRVALDQQPFIQGYLSVALSALAIRTATFPSQLLYQTGPVVVDRFTKDLIGHAKLEQAAYPECTTTNNNNTSTPTAASTTNVPCFNRSTVKFQSTFHAAAGPAGAWAAPLRSGIYQSSIDMRVRVDDLLQTKIDPAVNQAGYMALNNENSLPVKDRTYQGVMMVSRGAAAVSYPMIYNLTQHGMPIVTINNMYKSDFWIGPQDQALAHAGSDDSTIVKYVVQRLLSMGKCKKLALLDPDQHWSTDHVFTDIRDGVVSGGLNTTFVFADSSSPSACEAAISAAKAQGIDCWFLGTFDVQLAVLDKLNIVGNPAYKVGVFDFNARVLDFLQRGKISWAMSQGMFYQGYLPPMLLTLLWLTGGPERGNRLLKTNNITNEDSYYSWVNFPYVESGPQFLTPKTHGLANLANCAPAVAGDVPPTMTLPALVNIRDFPFARMAFPVCVEPPPRYYAVITTPDMIQRFQPNYDNNCPAGTATKSPSWCSQGPANATNVPTLSYTLDASSYIPTTLIVVLLNYAQQLVPSSLTDQWRALLNNNDLLVTSRVISSNSTWPSFDYSSNSTSLLILGSSSARLVNSIATFPAFGLEAPPGTQVDINFALTLLDGQRIQTNTINIVQPACVPGQYAQVKTGSAGRNVHVCTPCASGYASYRMNAEKCDVITSYIPVTGAAVVQGVIGFIMVLFVVAIISMLIHRHHPMIRSFSPVYCCISLTGVVLVLCAALLMLDTTASTMLRSCIASVYLFNVGFTLAFGAVWTKLFRLWRIFNNPMLHMIVISNKQLVAALTTMVAIDVAIISTWLSIAPYELRTDHYQTCVSDKSNVFNGLLIGTKGALVASAAWLTYKTRAIPSRFNESKAITLTIYNTAIISVVLCFLWLGLEGAVGNVIVTFIKALGITLGCVSFVILLFSPLLRVLYKHAKASNLEHATLNSTKHSGSGGVRSGVGIKPRKSSGGNIKSGRDSPRRSSVGADAATSSAGVDSLLREHGAAFQLGKGDVDADLEEGLAGLFIGSNALDAVVKELKQKEDAGSIHPLEQRIISSYRDMTTNRTKVIEHYRKYKRAIMTIALVNAQLHEAKRTGTLDQYEPATTAGSTPARRRSDIVTAANAAAAATCQMKERHGSEIGTGCRESDELIKSSSPYASAAPAPASASVGINLRSGSSGRTGSRDRAAVSPHGRSSSVSTSTIGLIHGSGFAGVPRSSSIIALDPSHQLACDTDVQSPSIGSGSVGVGAVSDLDAAAGAGAGGDTAISISPHHIQLEPQAGTDDRELRSGNDIGSGSGSGYRPAARNFV